jgi:hypothetical protein
MVKLWDANRQRVHLGLAIGLPTADVEEKQGGVFLPYGMQLGSGTWDLKPSLTYLGQGEFMSWGGQISGSIRLEDGNCAGFAPGDEFGSTIWLAANISDWASIAARLNYLHQEGWEGHYDGPHNHAAPPHFIENYGGDVLEAGVGINLRGTGILKGHRLAFEALWPVYQDANGVQMDRDVTLTAGWQFSF